jgi:HK97 gp10 family phage protein
MSKAQIIGDRGLIRALEHMKQSSARKIMRPAINRGLTLVNKEAKRRAPKGAHGQLKRAIGKKMTRTKGKDRVSGMVYVRWGFEIKKKGSKKGRMHNPAKIAHLVEFGHGGPHPAPPHPFLRPALSAKQSQVKTEVTSKARERLAKEAAKARAKGKSL